MSDPVAHRRHPDEPVRSRNRRLGLRLALVALAMVAFAPVLYVTGGMLCSWAGIGLNPGSGRGVTSSAASAAPAAPAADGARRVSVTFKAVVDESLEGDVVFTVDDRLQNVAVGDAHNPNLYRLRNVSGRTLFIRPIHSVSPSAASRKFLMTRCFCFDDMILPPDETVELPLVYGYQADMDVRVRDTLVSYTLHEIERDEVETRGGPGRPADDTALEAR